MPVTQTRGTLCTPIVYICATMSRKWTFPEAMDLAMRHTSTPIPPAWRNE